METKFFPEDLVVGKSRNGKIRYAVIAQTPGKVVNLNLCLSFVFFSKLELFVDMESDEFDSDYDYDEDELAKGFVRLSWYPEGKHETVDESKVCNIIFDLLHVI